MRKRKTESFNIIEKFANAPLLQAMSMIRCGFELETELFNGHTYNEVESGGNDEERDYSEEQWEAANDRAYEAWQDDSSELFADWWDIYLSTDLIYEAYKEIRTAGDSPAGALTKVKEIAEEVFIERDYFARHERIPGMLNLIQKAARGGQSTYESLFESIHEDVVSNWEYPEPDLDSWPYINNVEFVSDSTVSGPEIRTVGGLSVPQFLSALEEVTSNQLSVGNSCSFHLHLSLNGIEHKYGKKLAAALMEYFLTHWGDLPAGVQKRLARKRQYFMFNLTPDKYRFVHWHEQGTLEFRLFGNVSTYADGVRCLRMAVRALQYAYKVAVLKTVKPAITVEEITTASYILEQNELRNTAMNIGMIKTASRRAKRDEQDAA